MQQIQESDYLMIVIGLLLILIVLGAMVIILLFKKNRQLGKEHHALKKQVGYFQVQCEIQQQLLRYTGKEMHDNLGQLLSLIKLNLGFGVGTQANESKALVVQAIAELRQLSRAMRTDFIQQLSLGGFIEYELKKIKKQTSISIQWNEEVVLEIQNIVYKMLIFRIVQDCLYACVELMEVAKLTIISKVNLPTLESVIVIQTVGQVPSQGLDLLQKRLESNQMRIQLIDAKLSWSIGVRNTEMLVRFRYDS